MLRLTLEFPACIYCNILALLALAILAASAGSILSRRRNTRVTLVLLICIVSFFGILVSGYAFQTQKRGYSIQSEGCPSCGAQHQNVSFQGLSIYLYALGFNAIVFSLSLASLPRRARMTRPMAAPLLALLLMGALLAGIVPPTARALLDGGGCGWIGVDPSEGYYEPLIDSDLFSTASGSEDITTETSQKVSQAAVYAGNGIEPMADAAVSVSITCPIEGCPHPFYDVHDESGAQVRWPFIIVTKADGQPLDPSTWLDTDIPLKLGYRMHLSVSVSGVDLGTYAYGVVTITRSYPGTPVAKAQCWESYQYGSLGDSRVGTLSFTAHAGSFYCISVAATVSAGARGYQSPCGDLNICGITSTAEAHAVVDPYLYIDPESPLAEELQVYALREALLDPLDPSNYVPHVRTPIDFDGDGYFSDVDCDDEDPAIHPGAIEIIDGKDNDCDGLVDLEDNLEVSYFSESVLGFVLPSGTALITSSFFDTELPLDADPSDQAFSDCLVASIITQDLDISAIGLDIATLAGAIPELQAFTGDLQRFYPITPQTMFIALYEDIPVSAAASRAKSAADIFSRATGVRLSLLISLNQTLVDGGNLAVVIYQSDQSFEEVADLLMELMPIARGGLTWYIDSAYERDMLTPLAHGLSSDGTVISVGFVSREATVFPFLAPVEIFLPPAELGLVPYISQFSYFGGYFHSSPQVHTLKFSQILNTTEKMTFSPQANASTIAAIAPQKNVTAEGKEVIIPKVSIATTLPAIKVKRAVGAIVKGVIPGVEAPEEAIKEAVKVTKVETGGVVEEEDVSVSFEFRFPLRLRVVKSLSVGEIERRQEITVTIDIINDDIDAGEEVRLDDSRFLSYYPLSAEVVEGSTEMYWQTIPGESTLSHTYKLRLIKEGIYTIPSATVDYEYEGSPYTATSNIVSALVRGPSLIQLWVEGVPLAWRMAAGLINLLPQAGGMGELILMAAVIVIIVIIALMEFRGLRKKGGK